ncbi:MAG: TonB-dependent receptor [Pseudomonadota bacterium]
MNSLNRRIAAVLTGLALLAAASSGYGQQEPVEMRELSIAAGPLARTLIEISNAFEVSILADSAVLSEQQAPAINGTLNLEGALQRALEGSGLAISESRSGAYRLTAQATQSVTEETQRSAPPPSGEPVEELIVFGVKQNQSLQDVEISTEIFSEARLAREQITELSELLLKVPNVTTIGGADSNFSMRGIGRAGVGGAGQGVTSSVYVDGSPVTSLNFNRGPLALWDLEQVEVLRGPQSSIQGRNALAGAIFVKTADPTFEPEGKLRLTYAEGETYQAAGALGGPLIDGWLAGRIAFDAQGSDGFLSNTTLGGIDFNVTESLTIRSKLLLAPERLPKFTTKLTVDIGASEVFGEDALRVVTPTRLSDPNFTDFDPSALVTARDEPVNNDNEGLRVISETTYAFSDSVTGRALITYEDFSTTRTFGDVNQVSRFGGFTENDFEETIASVETRLELNFETVQGVVGFYLLEEERKSFRDSRTVLQEQARGLAGPIAPLVNVTPPDSLIFVQSGETFTTDNYAAFAQFDWQFAPKWTLGIGARYDQEEFSESGRFFNSGATPDSCEITAPAALFGGPNLDLITLPCGLAVAQFFGPNSEPVTSADFSAFLPRASLTHQINDNSSVFASLSRGYRAGGAFVAIEQNPLVAGFTQFVGEYDPEFLDTFEIGTRNILLDGRLTLNANVFYSKYDDQQVLVDGFDPTRGDDDLIVNAGESTLYGLEFSADYKVNDSLGVFWTLGLLEAEFDDFPFAVDTDGNPTNPADPSFANLAGNSFSNAPGVTFTLGANWESESGWFGYGSLSYTGEVESSVLNIDNDDLRQALQEAGDDPNLARGFESAGEARFDLTGRFGWQSDTLQVFVFGTNLLDADAFTSRGFANVGTQTGTINLQSPNFVVQPPRIVGVGLEVRL